MESIPSTGLSSVDLPMVQFTKKKKQRLEDNYYAPMQPKTLKILEKIKRKMGHIDAQITDKNLEHSSKKIRWRIARHTPQRIVVDRDFNLTLFNGNKNPASVSRIVDNIRERLRASMNNSQIETQPDLKGRVSKRDNE